MDRLTVFLIGLTFLLCIVWFLVMASLTIIFVLAFIWFAIGVPAALLTIAVITYAIWKKLKGRSKYGAESKRAISESGYTEDEIEEEDSSDFANGDTEW